MSTIVMKLLGAIVVGGHIIRPPAFVEVTPAEAANLSRRGKAVAATENDQPSAVSPSAENVNAEGAGSTPQSAEPGAGADAVALRDQANAAAAAVEAAKAVAATVEGKSRAQKKADINAVDAAVAAHAAAEAAALAAEAILTPAT